MAIFCHHNWQQQRQYNQDDVCQHLKISNVLSLSHLLPKLQYFSSIKICKRFFLRGLPPYRGFFHQAMVLEYDRVRMNQDFIKYNGRQDIQEWHQQALMIHKFSILLLTILQQGLATLLSKLMLLLNLSFLFL